MDWFWLVMLSPVWLMFAWVGLMFAGAAAVVIGMCVCAVGGIAVQIIGGLVQMLVGIGELGYLGGAEIRAKLDTKFRRRWKARKKRQLEKAWRIAPIG